MGAAIATPWAAQWNMGMSLGMSPKAMVRRRLTPRRSAASASPVALVMPHGWSSTVPGPDMVTVAREPTTARAVAANSSSDRSGWRSSTLLIGLAHSSSRRSTRTAGSVGWGIRYPGSMSVRPSMPSWSTAAYTCPTSASILPSAVSASSRSRVTDHSIRCAPAS